MSTTPTITKHPLYTKLGDGRWDFYIDHSKLKDFRLCEQFFDYRHIQNKAAKGKNPYSMDVGSWWSEVMERIYLHIKDHGTISRSGAQEISADVWMTKNLDLHKDDKRYKSFGGYAGAIIMMDQYYDRHLEQDAKQWKIIAAESGFGLKGEVLVGENSEVVVHWVGKPDLLVLEAHRLTPLDHKTVTRIDSDIHARYKPNPQIIGYAFATEHLARQLGLEVSVDRCIINVCSRTEPSDKPRDGKPVRPRFIRVLVGYSPSEIKEWQVQTVEKVTRLRHAIERGVFLWNEYACSNMYFRPCPYRMLCSVAPGARPDVLRGNYIDIQPWIPYEVEEDSE